ncbi:MAG TPA: flagellar hook-associated protein, partial [Sedimenticola sp.]|nr:flagellar hook-associated protein [Sedimenticola sp.]
RALDAALQVDGVSVTRGANSISDVVAGVTFQLKGAGRAVATVIKDTSAASNAVNGFVKAYNDLKGQISSLSETTLKGNSLLRSIESRVRGVLNQALTGLGDVTYISQLGITTNQDTGRLQVDSAKLDTALKENADSVAAFFSDTENGFATRMNDVLDGFLASGGIIDNVIEGANSRIDSIDSQRTTLERRLEAIEKRYRNQFTALDNMMARLNTTSDYLTRQLDSLANMLNNK